MNYRQQSDTLILPVVIIAILYTIFLSLLFVKHDHDFSALVMAGDLFVDANAAPPNLSIITNSAGYDGQFYYRLALTPFTDQQTDWGITIDAPAYRQQRIVYPLLGRLLSLGNPVLLPVSLVIVNFLALCTLAWLGGKYVQAIPLHAIWGVSFALFPGFLLTLSRDTTEIVEIAFLFAAILALCQKRQFLGGILLILAVLTKETALIMSFGLLLESLFIRHRRKFQELWFPIIMPIVAYFLWQTWLKSIWDNASVTGTITGINFGLPLVGLSHFIHSLLPPPGHLQQVWLLELFCMALFILAVTYVFLQSAARQFIKASWLLFVALMFLLTQAVWVEDWAFLRVFSETYLFGMLILLEAQSTLKKWFLGVVTFSWILLAIEVLKMR